MKRSEMRNPLNIFSMLSKIQSYIKSQNLLIPGSTIIVGLSGGADSVVLLYILNQLGYKCIAAHGNFHLRGDESSRDELFSKSFAESLNIPFEKIDFDTKEYAEKQGVSIEMAARELRYNWFENLRKEYEAEAIAVAHHQDDSVETFLLNIIRGTGIHGLTGIKPKMEKISRPLLCVNKQEILDYAEQEKLLFVTDSSNLENNYIRNKIRLDILPEMKEINPSVDEAILRTIRNLQSVSIIYDTDIKFAEKQVFDKEKNSISIPELQLYIEPKALLYEILKPFGFNATVVNEIFESLNSQSGKEFFSAEFKLVKNRETLLIVPKQDLKEQDCYKIEKKIGEVPGNLSFQLELNFVEKTPGFEIVKEKGIAYFDAALLKFPLILRHWKAGDRFIPFGMKGSRKLSDYFNDLKISKIDKEKVWLLCSGDDIIWIVGERTDNRYRIKDTTQNVCIVACHFERSEN